jgi:molybdate transport system ATP-binding protein
VSVLDAALSLRHPPFELDVDLRVDERGLVLVGPNGAGKTTTLLVLAGVRPVSRGRIVLDGTTLLDSERAIDLSPDRRRVAYVPQDYALFPHMTAEENVAFSFGALEAPPPRRERRRRARALLDDLGVADLAARRPATLSGGEKQRVALARALAVDPRALLFDEPLAALDVETRDEVRSFLVATLQKLGRPYIVVTHDRDDARAFGAPIAVLEGGRIVQRGEFETLARDPATPFVSKLFAARRDPAGHSEEENP